MLMQLVRAAIVFADHVGWGSQGLGANSVIRLDERILRPNPIGCLEYYVTWVDVVGRESGGWLAKTTQFADVRNQRISLVNTREDLQPPAIDLLRDRAYSTHLRAPKEHWTFAAWLRIFGNAQYDVLATAVREGGGIVNGTETVDQLTDRVLRLAISEDPDMSTETEEATTPAKVKKAKSNGEKTKAKKTNGVSAKSPAKKAKGETPAKPKRETASEGGRQAAFVTAGETLVPLLKKFGNDKTRAIVAKMAEGKAPSAAQYIVLRDGVNEAATAAREADKTDIASELSAANRLVRRLARAADAE